MKLITDTILHGDARRTLRALPSESVHTVITRPPYWGLRDYGAPGQLGLEPTPDEYVARMVEVFREVRRVLRSDGTLWLNLGDSFAGSWGNYAPGGIKGTQRPRSEQGKRWERPAYGDTTTLPVTARVPGLKPKDLVGIPWRVAFALQADGWWLRSDIIWHKPNPMPESVRDRPTKSHEYVFLLAKSERYYYDADAIAEPVVKGAAGSTFTRGKTGINGLGRVSLVGRRESPSRNRRDVWTIASQPYAGAHFATMPPALVEPCLLAGCPGQVCETCGAPWVRVTEKVGEVQDRWSATSAHATSDGVPKGIHRERTMRALRDTTGYRPTCRCAINTGSGRGVTLDPFGGAGTVGLVAKRHSRAHVLIELNAEYCQMAKERISREVQHVLWTAPAIDPVEAAQQRAQERR